MWEALPSKSAIFGEASLTKVEFQTVDVFTDRQFGGNPVAVISDARGLSELQMQAIANEFNLAETTFVLPPANPAHTARVRIFTPRAEMPFAGHPNVGTAFVLAHQASVCDAPFNPENMIFEEIAGLVRMSIDIVDGIVMGAALAAPQQFKVIRAIDAALVARACSLDPAEIEINRHSPCIASCGAPFVIAEVRDQTRCVERNREWMSSCRNCLETRRREFIFMSSMQKGALIFSRGCSLRCTGYLKTRRPAARMWR